MLAAGDERGVKASVGVSGGDERGARVRCGVDGS